MTLQHWFREPRSQVRAANDYGRRLECGCADDGAGITLMPWGLTTAEARGLWASVLRQAVEDVWGYHSRYGDHVAYPDKDPEGAERRRFLRLRDRNSARMWMLIEGYEVGGYGWICEHLGFDPQVVRDAVLAGPPREFLDNPAKFWARERGTRWQSA